MVWNVEGKKQEFCHDEKAGGLISKTCFKKNCAARTMKAVADTLVLKDDMKKRTSPPHPGSKYCKELEGKVMMGLNERGSQVAFCQAKDGTLISLSALATRKK